MIFFLNRFKKERKEYLSLKIKFRTFEIGKTKTNGTKMQKNVLHFV